MTTYLLTWNPTRWHWNEDDFNRCVQETARGKPVAMRWSCGNTKRIVAGDRVFLLRQGVDRGMIASGHATSASYYDAHWDEARDDQALYVDVRGDVVLAVEDVLPIETLQTTVRGVRWNNIYASGIRVSENAADALEQLWAEHLISLGRRSSLGGLLLAEEVDTPERFVEGATCIISVNAYERNAVARSKCVEHYGATCVVCGFNFEAVYGELGKDFIHVHHLRDLASIGEEYEVDPVADLRPVCPNCHAMLHRKTPPLTVGELHAIVEANA
jgi:5-methylcytosine-specific restriction protein A